MRSTCLGGLILALMLLTACEGPPKTDDDDINVVDEPEKVQAMTRPDAKERAVLVDVRKPEAFIKGHIPGAVNIPLPQLRPGDPRLSQAKTIVVYAQGAQSMWSQAAASSLLVKGYSNIYNFRGGIEAWREAGLELHSGEPATP